MWNGDTPRQRADCLGMQPQLPHSKSSLLHSLPVGDLVSRLSADSSVFLPAPFSPLHNELLSLKPQKSEVKTSVNTALTAPSVQSTLQGPHIVCKGPLISCKHPAVSRSCSFPIHRAAAARASCHSLPHQRRNILRPPTWRPIFQNEP